MPGTAIMYMHNTHAHAHTHPSPRQPSAILVGVRLAERMSLMSLRFGLVWAALTFFLNLDTSDRQIWCDGWMLLPTPRHAT